MSDEYRTPRAGGFNRSSGPDDGRPGGRGPREGREGRDGGPPRRRRFGGGGGGGRYYPRRKVCSFCMDHIDVVDYKDFGRLRRYVSDRGKIEPRRQTGTCARHQRSLAVAIKRARHLALLPFTQ